MTRCTEASLGRHLLLLYGFHGTSCFSPTGWKCCWYRYIRYSMCIAYSNVKVISHWELRKLHTEKLYVIYSESLLHCKFVMVGNTVVIRNTHCSLIRTWQPKYHIRNQMYIFTDIPLWLLTVLKPVVELWVILQSWNCSWNMQID